MARGIDRGIPPGNAAQHAKRPAGATSPLRAPPGACGAPPRISSRAEPRKHRKAPSASATPCPPAALRCSTLGEGGLNCRVRDGTGSIPASVVALAGGAPPRPLYEACQEPLSGATLAAAWRARQKIAHRARCFSSRMRRARAISAARLSASPRLHLRPIDQVVYLGPYRRVDSSRRRLPA